MPVGVRPATASKSAMMSNSSGMATVRPRATTSLATAEAVRRWLKISRSSNSPSAGASTNTERMRAGTMPQPHSSRALKNIAADTYACAPNARLNTPDVL